VGFKAWLSNCIRQSEPGKRVKIQLQKLSALSTADIKWGKSTGTSAVTAQQSHPKRWKHHTHLSSPGIKHMG